MRRASFRIINTLIILIGPPTLEIGIVGDLYIDKTNLASGSYTIYGPKTAADGWGDGTTITGSVGGGSGITQGDADLRYVNKTDLPELCRYPGQPPPSQSC